MGLKWRLAILSRDQQKWNQYVDVLSKELVNAVDKVEEKVDIYQEMIRVYRDETKQESMVLKMYEALLAVAPGNRAALESLVEIYEKMRRWPELVKLLDTPFPTHVITPKTATTRRKSTFIIASR